MPLFYYLPPGQFMRLPFTLYEDIVRIFTITLIKDLSHCKSENRVQSKAE